MRAPSAPLFRSIVDRLTPEAVLAWIPYAVEDDARTDVERGRVARPRIGGRAVESIVADDRLGRVAVRIGWGADAPVSECDCGARRGPCRHAAALGLLLVGAARPDEGAPAPGLSAADREREVRRARGASELFDVRPFPGTKLYGRYEVRSPSARSYEVTLRALDEPHNGCTCPDLATNLLGTCKHIEAVLHRLRTRSERRFRAAARSGPEASYLHLSFDPEPSVAVRLAADAKPRARRVRMEHFTADGRLASPLAERWPDLYRDATEAGIDVPREVETLAERVRWATDRAARRRAIEAEVRGAGREQPGVRATLYPYQVEGVAFLASRGRALLADEMGLGKTAQAIAAMVRLARKEALRRTLVICPASLKRQWQREIERFTDLGPGAVAVVQGPREDRRRRYADPPAILITSYELARTDEAELAALAPDLLILDEAQRIKNWRTKTADAVKRIPSRHAFVLTGTPLENRLDDLYSLMQVIDPHLFGPLWRFNERYTNLDERGRVGGYKNLDDLRRSVAPAMLRRRKDDVALDLPSRIVNRLTVPMTAEQRALHDEAEGQVARLLTILKKRPLTPQEEQRLLRAFQRMRMSCDAAGLVDKETVGAPKLDELAGLLEEVCVEGGHKVVIFSEWERMQAMAAGVCQKLRVGHVRLHGGVPSGARGALIDRFVEDPECKVFLSTDAGGTGLNLQAASHLVNLDLPWNPAVLAQRIGRVHRIGQRSSVNVVLLVSEASFEERLEGSLDAKRALFAAAVGDDQETTEIQRGTLASRISTLMRDEFAATTGAARAEEPAAEAAPPALPPANDVDLMRERLGDALERVVRLPDGRLLGVIRGAGAPPPVTVPAVLLSRAAADALLPLGEASPLAQAEVLYRAEAADPPDPAREARRAVLSAAERKLAAAAALTAAGMGGEALGMLREALALGCRAAAEDGDPGDEGAALLSAVYGRMIPAGSLTEADAHALARAGELSRVFGASAAAPPEGLVAGVEREARDLLARVRERTAGGASVAMAQGAAS
jgi:superfamily II DNA or RNA helicase